MSAAGYPYHASNGRSTARRRRGAADRGSRAVATASQARHGFPEVATPNVPTSTRIDRRTVIGSKRDERTAIGSLLPLRGGAYMKAGLIVAVATAALAL